MAVFSAMHFWQSDLRRANAFLLPQWLYCDDWVPSEAFRSVFVELSAAPRTSSAQSSVTSKSTLKEMNLKEGWISFKKELRKKREEGKSKRWGKATMITFVHIWAPTPSPKRWSLHFPHTLYTHTITRSHVWKGVITKAWESIWNAFHSDFLNYFSFDRAEN